MQKQLIRGRVLPKVNRSYRDVLVFVWWIVIVLLTTAHSISAVDTEVSRPLLDPLLSRYLRFGRLTTEDGLSSDQAWHVAQDNHGFMWFATANGLNRYDGSSVKVYRHDPDDPYSLGHNIVRAMIKDQSGDLWLGTWGGGLNQYDPAKDAFIRYQHNPDDPSSLSNNAARAVYADRTGTVWVGTHAGLNKLDREKKQFTRYLHDPDDPNSLSHDFIWSILEDSAGVLWVGTEEGFNRFDPETEQFVHYRHDPDDPASLSHNTVRSIYEDRSGNLWLGTRRGLCKFNRDRTRFTQYLHDTNDFQTLSNNLVTGAYEDRAGRLWVSTWGGGLNRFDRKTETFVHYKHDPADPYSLSSDTVFQVYEDQQGMFWIASVGGISVFDGRGKPFQHYRAISHLPNTLSHNVVRALHAGRAGVVWVGTSGGGLNKFDRQTEAFTHYRHDPADPNSLSNDTVRAIYEDRMGLIWVGTSQLGLNRFDPDTERFTHFRHDAANHRSISKGSIIGINEDSKGTLWICTWGGGLNAFDRETEQFTRYQHDPTDPHTLSHNQVICVLEDQADVLWVGTIRGLNKLNRETKRFTRYQHVATDPQSLGHDSVISMCVDRTGTLWLGTVRGLDKFDRKNDQFDHYTTKNGLPSDTIMGILEDEQGRLWLSTSNGLSRFDPRTESFRNYDVSDGLQSNTFLNFSSYSKSRSGEMFFGGSNGFNAFYPDQIVDNPHPPPVLIADFQLANKPVPIGADSVLQKSILESDNLVLSYRDRVFSFELAVLNYRAPQQNRYRYRMEGFEKQWNEVDRTRRFAAYTNLDPGEYVFRAIGANNDGIWNEEGDSIRITVTPPWWGTMWFRIIMAAVALGLLVGGFRWRIRASEARSRKLEIQVQKRTQELSVAREDALKARDAAETANQAKSIFLANMSHELRTPLNAILGFSGMLAREKNAISDQQQKLSIINRSGQHLLSMINDVLDLSKIEAGRIELQEDPFNLVALIKEISVMIQSSAAEKGISVAVEAETTSFPYVKADIEKLRQILNNLLNNAVKFTDKGGVTIRCGSDLISGEPNRCHIVIEVEDTGPGIDPARQAKIFEPFVQGVDVLERKGTGLGLAICKKYAEFMGGTIELESEVGKGSLFRLRLPAKIAEAADVKTSVDDKPRVIGLAPTQKTWRILVADDNRENLLLLKSLLESVGFFVLEAANGKEAVAAFKKESPDFIWMDMRMPVMSGYEATKRIRKWEARGQKTENRGQRTDDGERKEEGERLGRWEGENKSEIRNPKSKMEGVPIIAVTASAFREQQQEILAAGCDDMVIKPFQAHEIFEAMGRLLDIEYVYEEKDGAAPSRTDKVELASAMLADLPDELLRELRQATRALNREASLEVISRIADHAPEVAAGLKELVDNFQMTELQELLEDIE